MAGKLDKKYISEERASSFQKLFSISVDASEGDTVICQDIVRFPSRFKMFATIENFYDPDMRDCLKYLK